MSAIEPHAWVEVDLSAIRHNYRQVAGLAGPGCRIIPVVKGNAYGHGMAQVAAALASEGASALAVTHAEEGAALRDAGIETEILLLAPPRGEAARATSEMGLSPCVMDACGAEELARYAADCGKRVRVHLKIDTGMGRLGVRPDYAVDLAKAIVAQSSLELAGVCSHCAEGASEPAAARQLRAFTRCVEAICAAGIAVPVRHIAASAAFLSLPESRLDAARIGNLIYGQYPASGLKKAYERELDLRDTWRFCSRIIAIRSLPPGSSVGYGAEFQTPRVSRIALVAAGLADGLGMIPESIAGKGLKGAAKSLLKPRFTQWVKVRGSAAPIVGRIAMQICSVDVTDIPEAAVGDVVELPVRRIAAAGVPIHYSG